MNESTLVVVQGHWAYLELVEALMPMYLHHKCPMLLLSPEDAPLIFPYENEVTCELGGKSGYTGEVSIARQRIYLKLALRFPYEFFLILDADSLCLSPEIPRYVYEAPYKLWSNIISDSMHARPEGYTWPHMAFQTPYFAHRSIIEKLVYAEVEADPLTPFVDWAWMAWAIRAGVPYQSFPDGLSCPTINNAPGAAFMRSKVRNEGTVFVHAVKEPGFAATLAEDHRQFVKNKI